LNKAGGIMRKLLNKKGMTVIELLIVSLMTCIVAAAGFHFFIRVNQQYISQEDITETQQNVRASLQELCREIRMAGYNTPDTVSAYELVDLTGDSDTLTVNRDTLSIKYYIDRSDTLHPMLMKSVNDNAEIYADEIKDMQINVISTKSIEVSITANSAKFDDQVMGGHKFERTLTQVVSLRNVN